MNIKIPTIRSLFVAAALIAGVGAASTNTVQASLVLTLESGATTIVVADNGAGDLDGAVGMIAYMGAVGNFTSNMTGGYGIGYAPWPTVLNLAGFSMSGTGGGTLTITLEEDGYVPSNPQTRFISTVGGTIGTGTASSRSYFDAANTGSLLGAIIADHGTTGAMSFSSDIVSQNFPTPSAYGLAVQLTITHATSGSTQYTNQIRIDESATLGLFGLALVGIGLLTARRRTR